MPIPSLKFLRSAATDHHQFVATISGKTFDQLDHFRSRTCACRIGRERHKRTIMIQEEQTVRSFDIGLVDRFFDRSVHFLGTHALLPPACIP